MSIKGLNAAHWHPKTQGLGALKLTATNLCQGPTASPCSRRSHHSLSPYPAPKDKQTLHGQVPHHHPPLWNGGNCHTASAQFLLSLARYRSSVSGTPCTVLLGTSHKPTAPGPSTPLLPPGHGDMGGMSSASAVKIHLPAWRGDCGPEAKLASAALSCHFLCAEQSHPQLAEAMQSCHTSAGMCDSRRKG